MNKTIKNGEDNKKPRNSETDKFSECEKKRDEYLAGWKRAKADLINYKKDESMRAEMMIKYANEGLIGELIMTLDSFDLGISVMEKKGEVEKGIYMIRSQITDTLKRHGLERIEVDLGDKFNPEIAEAVSRVESNSPEGEIVEEVEAGYRLHDKVIRPARVKISRGKVEK